MNWKLVYLPEAAKDLKNLAGNQRLMVVKAINKVLQNPLPVTEGGYGKPLGNKQGNDLAGLLKIKLRDAGIRVVYKLIRTETEMLVVVIGTRADDEVYETAQHRAKKNHYEKQHHSHRMWVMLLLLWDKDMIYTNEGRLNSTS